MGKDKTKSIYFLSQARKKKEILNQFHCLRLLIGKLGLFSLSLDYPLNPSLFLSDTLTLFTLSSCPSFSIRTFYEADILDCDV